MRILISGGCGFIGSNLVRMAIARGHHIANVDALTYAGNPASLEDVQADPRYRFEQLDICDGRRLRQVLFDFRPDCVIHLAAESHNDHSIDQPGIFVDTNVRGTFNLLQSSLEYFRRLPESDARGFRFLNVSTDEVYGSLPETGSFREQSRYDPHSPYAASKAAADHFARAWHHTYQLPVLVSNCSNNYGPFQFPEKLVPVVILKGLLGEPIPIYGSGENVRDWLFVEDHCDALLQIVDRGRPGETYNIGGQHECSNLELARHLCRLLDELQPRIGGRYEQTITMVDDRPGHDFRYAIDATKIRQELGWNPRSDFDASLRRTVQWYLDHRSWWEPLLSNPHALQRQGTGQTEGRSI